MTRADPAAVAPPLPPYSETVRPEWVDYNGHMNVASYVLIFDHATDALLDAIGIGEGYRRAAANPAAHIHMAPRSPPPRGGRAERGSLFIVEAHVAYLSELIAGDPVRIETQILGHDDKRLHAFLRMVHAESGELAATYEILGLHVNMKSRRAAPFPAFARERIRALAALHASLPRPAGAGRGVSLRSRG